MAAIRSPLCQQFLTTPPESIRYPLINLKTCRSFDVPKISVKNSKSGYRSTVCMVVANETALYAKEMERVSAKEALILAIKDAGGVDALSTGEGNVAAKIEVSEKVLALERLNPTPRPTTSPLLEGSWQFLWAGARSPGLTAAKVLLKRFPSQLAALDKLTLEILQGGTVARATLKILGSVETSFTLTTKLSVGGPLRLKEEYVEGILSTPEIKEENIPEVLKGILAQLSSASQSLPESVKEALAKGLTLPLSGAFERQVLVSYLDDEILVARDQFGLPDVLVRLGGPPPQFEDEAIDGEFGS